MNLASSFRRPGGSADEGFGVLAVEVEEEFQPFQFRLEGCGPETKIDGSVQRAVGVKELLRHGIGIVEIGKRGISKFGPDVQDPLRCCDDSFNLHRRWRLRPWEIVVDKVIRVTVITFQSAANLAHPSHVHDRGKDAKVVE